MQKGQLPGEYEAGPGVEGEVEEELGEELDESHTPKGEAIIKEENMKPRKFKGCPKYQNKE